MLTSTTPKCVCELYDPLRPQHHVNNPVVIGLKAVEKGKGSGKGHPKEVMINHCVCTVGSLMFDSNMQWAMPLDLEALNRSVFLVNSDCIYAGVLWSREILLKERENRPGYRRS